MVPLILKLFRLDWAPFGSPYGWILLAGADYWKPNSTHDEELGFCGCSKGYQGRVPLIAGCRYQRNARLYRIRQRSRWIGFLLLVWPLYPITINLLRKACISTLKLLPDASNLPIIIYNIPGRVVVEMTPETMLRVGWNIQILSALKNVPVCEYGLSDRASSRGVSDLYRWGWWCLSCYESGGWWSYFSSFSHKRWWNVWNAWCYWAQWHQKKAAAIQRKFIPKSMHSPYPSPAPVKAVLNYLALRLAQPAYLLCQHLKKMLNALLRLDDGDYQATKELLKASWDRIIDW